MKYRLLISLLIITSALLGNSIFSFEGMPLQYYGNDVYGMGMGDTGAADLFRINPNFSNPSIVTSTNKVLFSTAVSMGNVWYEDAENNSFRDDGMNLPYFQIAVPILDHRFAFSFNSVASGDIENERNTFFETSAGDTLFYSETNKLSSSLFKAEGLYAFKNPIVNIGIGATYYLGHRIRYWKCDFGDVSITDTKYEIEKTFKNPGYSIGLSKKIGKVSLGATYSNHVKLEGETKFKFDHDPWSNTIDHSDDYLFEVAPSISGAVTVKFLERFKASFDAHYDMWEDTELYDKNTLKAGLGLAYDPLSGYGKWYERIPVRIGGYIRELPFEANNEKIMEQVVTFGSSIPLKSANKKIEIAVQYLTRGNIDDNNLSDSSLMFTFGITGFDIFKKRPKKIEHREIPKADKGLVR